MFFDFLYDMSGLKMFTSRLFAASLAVVFSFILGLILFPPYIKKLQDLHFSSELEESKNQPVMPAGILFIVVVLGITVLTSRFNQYVISALVVYLFYGLIGAADDIAKIVNKRKLLRNEITKQEYQYKTDGLSASLRLGLYLLVAFGVALMSYHLIPHIGDGHTTFPLLSVDRFFPSLPWWVFIPIMTFVIAVMANGVNFTDGFDTLSSVPLITNFAFLAIVAYITSRSDWSTYFRVPSIEGIHEIIPMIGAVVGVLFAFLWFNAPPSTIIMGDSGSIGLGGLVGILFIFVKAEFFLPIIGLVFLVEFFSSFIQIGWYKLTKKRLFLCAPIHHHFQFGMRASGNYADEKDIRSKLTWRFHIVSFMVFVIGLALYLKVR